MNWRSLYVPTNVFFLPALSSSNLFRLDNPHSEAQNFVCVTAGYVSPEASLPQTELEMPSLFQTFFAAGANGYSSSSSSLAIYFLCPSSFTVSPRAATPHAKISHTHLSYNRMLPKYWKNWIPPSCENGILHATPRPTDRDRHA